jgi:hypothetical protein
MFSAAAEGFNYRFTSSNFQPVVIFCFPSQDTNPACTWAST